MAIAVAQVGGNVTTTSAGAGISATFGSSTTSGSAIAAIDHVYNTSGAAAAGDITDNKSNTYQLGKALFGGVSATGIGGYYNNNGTRGSSHSLTANLVNSGGESCNLAMIEITGQDASSSTSCFDSASAQTANDATSSWDVTAAAAVPSGAIGVYGVTIDTGTNNAFTQPSGYSSIINQPDGVNFLVSCASYKLSESGTPTVGATSGHTAGAGSARELFMAFVPAASGAAATDSIDQTTIGRVDLTWQIISPFDALALPVTIIPVWVDAASSADVNVIGRLDTGTLHYAPFTNDITVVGHLPTAAPPYSTVTADRNVTAILEVADPLYATISADRNVAAHLPTATFLLNGVYASGFPTIGILFSGAPHYTTVTADRNVAAHLPTAAPHYASISHNASIVGHLPTAAPLWALVSGASDLNTIGLLFTGDFQRATVTADRTLSGLLIAAAEPRTTVSHTASIAARLDAGTFPLAVVIQNIRVAGHLPLAVVQYKSSQLPAPDLGSILTTTAIVDGKVVTVGIVNGFVVTAPGADGQVRIVGVIDGRTITTAINDGRTRDT